MTQTSLSAGSRAQRRYVRLAAHSARGFQWHRPARRGGHSCLSRGGSQPTKGLCAFAEAHTLGMTDVDPSLSAGMPRQLWRLIADLELESRVNPIRIIELKFSNRKYFAISRAPFQPCTTWLPASTVSSSRIHPLASTFQNLIETCD
jgi:hypothetical protein